MRKLVAGKLHGIYVSEANLNHHDSITLDPDHCETAGILPMEFVEIVQQEFRCADLDLCHSRRARLTMLHPQRSGCPHLPARRPDPCLQLHLPA